MLGAIGVNALKSWATRAYPDSWLLILGGMFILAVLFLPQGLAGVPKLVKQWLERRRHATEPGGEPGAVPSQRLAVAVPPGPAQAVSVPLPVSRE